MSKQSVPTLKKNDRGIWEIRWTDNRRSMRESTKETDYAKAEIKLAEFLGKRAGGKSTAAITVNEVLDIYDNEHIEKKVVDKRRQRDVIANLRPFFGFMLAAAIKPTDVELYEKKRHSGVVGARVARSTGTMRRELNVLVAAINYVSRTRAKLLPATDVPYIPLPTAPAAKDVWLTEKEVDQLLTVAALENQRYPEVDRGYLFTHIALATASRRRAIEMLKWDQVDMAARLIHFRPAGSVQTNKRRVAVPISDELLPVLADAFDKRTSDFVLHTDASAVRRFEAICERAFRTTGNEKFMGITPHTLRHTAATLMARAGVPLFEIAGVLGDTMQTVLRVYAHHCPDHLRGAVNYRARNGASGAVLTLVPGGRGQTKVA